VLSFTTRDATISSPQAFLIADALARCIAMVSACFGLIPAIKQAPSAFMFLMRADFLNSCGWM
jgi:hypothetical protein